MSAYPLMLDGESLSALVVGGGKVAARKVRGLLDAGARVRVVAPEIVPDIHEWAKTTESLCLSSEVYSREQLGESLLVIAATDDGALNARIASDARAAGRLVNVVSDPELGNCTTAAVHRAGDIVVAVSTGGVPPAAARIRDAIAARFDVRYIDAVAELSSLRRRLLAASRRDRWHAAAAALAGAGFCDDVESGRFETRMAEWR